MKRTLLFLSLFGILLSSTAIDCLLTRATSARVQQSKPTEIKIDPKSFDEFVGQYAFAENPDQILSFFREGDKFFLRATGQTKLEIFPATESKFFLKIIDADATFVRDSQNKVTGLTWRQNDHQTSAKKISNRPAIEEIGVR